MPDRSPSCGARWRSRTSRSPTSPTSRSSRGCHSRSLPGETVAIVGPTGAGKTTLVNLLMRFYEVDKGRITLDGVDIASLTREELRSKTGMVLQDTWLFGGTIAENIAVRRAGGDAEEIVAAAQASHVDHFVRTLPDGYDTLLDEEGASVSAGERQLITIARAFLAEPAILILDEATSSVDTRTEVLIQRAMAGSTPWSDELCHRVPALDNPRCRSHLGDGVGIDRRARYARGAARCGRCLCAPLRGAVRERDRRVRALPVLPWAKRAHVWWIPDRLWCESIWPRSQNAAPG